ncbi:ATP-dependent DNA helicase pif1-like [Tripterygium wilfordii]|uniref:ATP-dependent DNA helicase pif1-like n=1 Tax=Tripterygium wilfordii TaxID=458696 RepID=UPI0018F7F952|nr:ATP-dependent DNA helicase pif1-like [Tripterygium wilfordii]
MDSVNNKTGKTFFLSGYGGTGKTYLWKTIVSKIRSEGKFVIVVASSSIAALLLPGGRTTHSRFRIPIEPTEESTHDIKQGTQLARLICKTSLIIWDEAPMASKYCFESLDKTLRDILRNTFDNSANKPFGGLTTVLGGDFRQILPVIIQIGDGIVNRDDDNEWIEIPNDILLKPGTNALQTIVDSLYFELEKNYNDPIYLEERAILAPTNEVVDTINQFIVQKIQSEEAIYRSSDSICSQTSYMNNLDILYPTRFFNSLKISGSPKHQITLKVGLPIMLLRNINQSKGLCNGTRLIITQLGKWFVQAEIITRTNIGERVFIPRIVLSSSDTKMPFTIKRRQFPIDVCFAITINKSQGQTLKSVGIFLSRQVFTHGQLYVAVSRVTNRKGLKILQDDKDSPSQNLLKMLCLKRFSIKRDPRYCCRLLLNSHNPNFEGSIRVAYIVVILNANSETPYINLYVRYAWKLL